MTFKAIDYVNVFQGNSTVSTEKCEGVATTWAPIKGLSGNTHPGAVLPFGKMSVCAYSGGYPTGYGNNKLNCGEPVESLYEKDSILGVAHLHHSGTGAVGFYYNYALTVPFLGNFDKATLNTLTDEKASCGYYSARFLEKDIAFELTADKSSAFHRYTFPKDKGNIYIDFSNDGLYSDKRLRGTAGESVLKIVDSNTATASVILQGMTLYFTVYSDSGVISLWKNYEKMNDNSLDTNGSESDSFGVLFENTDKITNVVVSVSLVSEDKSIAENISSRSIGFEKTKINAENEWNLKLSKIEIEADDRDKEIFYSNLYHTLVKPCDWSGESPYYSENDFVLDFTTLWDIYKTQLPLIFTLYPEIGKKILNTYINMGKHVGVMPNLFDLSSSFNGEAQQARFLAGYLFSDAFYRNIQAENWSEILDLLVDILYSTDSDFFEKGECGRTTHTLDMAEACTNLSGIAKIIGRNDIAEKLGCYADKWLNAFDSSNGLLREDSEYYEGNLWNYSFRPMNDMKKRINMAGGDEKFTDLLDRFFGFTNPEDKSARFEGFNNETDMESPYAYNYVRRMDRLAEVIDSGNKYMFSTGKGGAPGNVDSGGLSACYIWNAIGIFPVSGQNLMLVGKPYFKKTVLSLPDGKTFTVQLHGDGKYVKEAVLNNNTLNSYSFKVTDMIEGGVLNLYT